MISSTTKTASLKTANAASSSGALWAARSSTMSVFYRIRRPGTERNFTVKDGPSLASLSDPARFCCNHVSPTRVSRGGIFLVHLQTKLTVVKISGLLTHENNSPPPQLSAVPQPTRLLQPAHLDGRRLGSSDGATSPTSRRNSTWYPRSLPG